jgi:hypothetical protein
LGEEPLGVKEKSMLAERKNRQRRASLMQEKEHQEVGVVLL